MIRPPIGEMRSTIAIVVAGAGVVFYAMTIGEHVGWVDLSVVCLAVAHVVRRP